MKVIDLAKEYQIGDVINLLSHLRKEVNQALYFHYDLSKADVKACRENITQNLEILRNPKPLVLVPQPSFGSKPNIPTPYKAVHTFTFCKDEVLSHKRSQLEHVLKSKYGKTLADTQTWEYQVTVMAFAAELAFENYCQENNLAYTDLNEEDPFSPQDYIVNGKSIDVKARCRIGSAIDRDYNRNHSDPGEIIALFYCNLAMYDAEEIEVSFLGIFEPKLILEAGLENVKIETRKFLNPLFFTEPDTYFAETNDSKTKSVEFFDHIAGIIENKTSYDLEELRMRLPACGLNKIQFDYARDLLDVLSIIEDAQNQCRFTTLPFKDCKIVFSADYHTIMAMAPFNYEYNTLLSYSWKTGMRVKYKAFGIKICECGCLLHQHDGSWIGKFTCKYAGKHVIKTG